MVHNWGNGCIPGIYRPIRCKKVSLHVQKMIYGDFAQEGRFLDGIGFCNLLLSLFAINLF